MPSGVVPHYRPMPSGVVPHYQLWLLVCCLIIDHACWAIATTNNILLAECRWKKDGNKSGATITEVPLHQTCVLIRLPLPHMPASTVHVYQTCSFIQIRVFVKCCSIRQDIWSVTNPSDMPTGRVPLPQVSKTCWLPSCTPS